MYTFRKDKPLMHSYYTKVFLKDFNKNGYELKQKKISENYTEL